MPLTPIDQRRTEREKNISLIKTGSNSINQFKKQIQKQADDHPAEHAPK